MAGLGSFTTLQHGDAVLTFIHVPSAFQSIPSGSYFVPACITAEARRDLLGRLDQRPKAVQRQLVHVNPTDLSLLLAKLGVSTAICANVSRGRVPRHWCPRRLWRTSRWACLGRRGFLRKPLKFKFHCHPHHRLPTPPRPLWYVPPSPTSLLMTAPLDILFLRC